MSRAELQSVRFSEILVSTYNPHGVAAQKTNIDTLYIPDLQLYMMFEMSCFIKDCCIIFTLRKKEELKIRSLDSEEKKHKERRKARVYSTPALRALSFLVSRGQVEKSNSRQGR
jgi:hypothetical protein